MESKMSISAIEREIKKARKVKENIELHIADLEWEYTKALMEIAERPLTCRCGKVPTIRSSENTAMHSIYSVQCDCGIMTLWEESISKAVSIWNKVMNKKLGGAK